MLELNSLIFTIFKFISFFLNCAFFFYLFSVTTLTTRIGYHAEEGKKVFEEKREVRKYVTEGRGKIFSVGGYMNLEVKEMEYNDSFSVAEGWEGIN